MVERVLTAAAIKQLIGEHSHHAPESSSPSVGAAHSACVVSVREPFGVGAAVAVRRQTAVALALAGAAGGVRPGARQLVTLEPRLCSRGVVLVARARALGLPAALTAVLLGRHAHTVNAPFPVAPVGGIHY
jgi:hypothetical protein